MKSSESSLPSECIITGISGLYEKTAPGRLLIKSLSRAGSESASKMTDYVVISRLLLAVIAMFTPKWVALGIAIMFIYDISIAHAAHLLNANVGSAGPGARLSAGRSLLIALFNISVLSCLFVVLYRAAEGCTLPRAIGMSWSTLTAQGLVQPGNRCGRIVALLHASTNLFMLTVVISTVLSGFKARYEVRSP